MVTYCSCRRLGAKKRSITGFEWCHVASSSQCYGRCRGAFPASATEPVAVAVAENAVVQGGEKCVLDPKTKKKKKKKELTESND